LGPIQQAITTSKISIVRIGILRGGHLPRILVKRWGLLVVRLDVAIVIIQSQIIVVFIIIIIIQLTRLSMMPVVVVEMVSVMGVMSLIEIVSRVDF